MVYELSRSTGQSLSDLDHMFDNSKKVGKEKKKKRNSETEPFDELKNKKIKKKLNCPDKSKDNKGMRYSEYHQSQSNAKNH